MENLDEAQLAEEMDEIMKKVGQVVKNLEEQGFGEKKKEESDN